MIPFGFLSSKPPAYNQPIPGMAIWLKADTGVYNGSDTPCSNLDYVALWQDQSGNNNNFTSPYSDPPVFQTNQIQGYPAVYFSDNQLISTSAVTPQYAFFVVNIPSVQGYTEWPVLIALAGGGDSGYIARLQDNNSSEWTNDNNNLLGVGRANGNSIGGYNTDSNPVTNDVFTQYTAGPNSGYLDADRTDTISIGQGDGRPIVANLVEVIIYDNSLTDAQIAHNEFYLNAKYSIVPPDFSDLIRWWAPESGFDGSNNWVSSRYGITMTGTAASGTIGNRTKPAIYCANGNGLVDTTNYTGTPISVYYIAQPNTLPSGRILQAVYDNDNWLLGFWGGQQGSFFFDGNGAWLYYQASDGNPHIYGMNTNGSYANCFGDGKLLFSGTDGFSSPNGLCIGYSAEAFSNEACPCSVGDILVYNVVHSQETAIQVMQWLNAKYGVY